MSRSLVILKDIKNWNIFSGLCIRRPAVIAPELKPLEKQVADLIEKVDFEKSHLSAHELRHEIETKRIANALSKGISNIAQESLITAREAEIMWELEAEQYKPAERLTENDKSENLKSAWRALDKPLYLLVQSPRNVSSGWNLPTAPVSDGKNLRQVADSIATSLLPPKAKWCIFGNTPVAVWLTRDRNKEDTGTQVYFFNVYVDRHWHGEDLIINNDFNINNFAWIPRTEFKKFIQPKTLLKTLKSFAIDY
ncbi:unnamed protein product [Schistosoma intercalatum]|nr:unnamed protein product [Schistosoma intercalatum]CAH8548810.1 unnamed protein product [Schistosoma intercalatum]